MTVFNKQAYRAIQAEMANKENWQPLVPNPHNIGPSIFVRKQQQPLWKVIRQGRQSNYHLCSLFRQATSLATKAGPRTFDFKTLTFDGAAFCYTINDAGDIFIINLLIDDDFTPDDTCQYTGLYRVENKHEGWITNNKKQQSMDFSHQWPGGHYAAVSGQFDSKEDAGRKMIQHLKGAYKRGVLEAKDDHYSLYFQPNRYNSNRHANELASLIQHGIEQDQPINWVVHGEGTETFINALNIIKTYPSLTPIQAQDGILTSLRDRKSQKQKVYFSNPRGRGLTEEKIKLACQQAGVSFDGININQYDLKNSDVRGKFGLNTGATVATLGVAGAGSIEGFDNIAKAFKSAVGSGSPAMTAFMLGCGVMLTVKAGQNLPNYCTALMKGFDSTFGSGNQNWAA